MGNEHNNLVEALQSLVGGVPGEELLEEFKASLLTEPVFKKLFGDNGQRVICNTQSSLNTAIVPLLELRWKTDSAQSQKTFIDGRIEGRMVFPASLKDDDLSIRRKIAFILIRFLASDRFDLFERVAGLTEFGKNINFNYAVAFNIGMNSLPGILLDIPYRIDIHKWNMAHPEIDPTEPLDGEVFSIETYDIAYQVEKDSEFTTVVIDTIPNED